MANLFAFDTLVLATHNKGKIAEMRDLLAPFVPCLLTLAELGLPEPEETGTTFYENATTKAVAAARASGYPALADDSGLCIDALDGRPGVYTADIAGYPRNFTAAAHRLHAEMGAAIDTHPAAHFISVLALAMPKGEITFFEGRVDGRIVWPGRGARGHGMDPWFMPDGYAKTFAEMTIAQKQLISHRGQALRLFLDRLSPVYA